MICWKMTLFLAGLVAALAVFDRVPVARAQGIPEGVSNLSPAQAEALIAERSGDPSLVLLDVRTPKEYAEGHIAGAILIDYRSPSFREEIGKLDRGKTFLVYCRTGNRTQGALKAMAELGFRNLLHLDGGILKWKEAGFPIAK